MQEQISPTSSFNWLFVILWTIATAAGWYIGLLLIDISPLGESGIGLTVSIAQWLVLQGRIPNAYWWILATAAGWIVGRLIALLLFPPEYGILSGSAIGAAIGSFQWLILHSYVHRTYWWIIISILGWLWAMTGVLGMNLIGVVAGAITGFALDFLFRQQQPKSTADLKPPVDNSPD
jgi:hypothetical protein